MVVEYSERNLIFSDFLTDNRRKMKDENDYGKRKGNNDYGKREGDDHGIQKKVVRRRGTENRRRSDIYVYPVAWHATV